jgi:hypothetical protein
MMSAVLKVLAATKILCRRQRFVTVSSAKTVKRITDLNSQKEISE